MAKRKGVCESVAEAVIARIKGGELKPGDRLPNEKDMAELYGVSRISLREALRYLAARGLIVTRHGDGTFVNTYEPGWLAEAIYEFSLLDDAPTLEALELRQIMETEAARLCCANATEEEIAEIRRYKEEREKLCAPPLQPEDADLRHAYDSKFHRAIGKGTHNDLFSRFIEVMRRTIDLHQREASTTESDVRETSRFHDEIMQAIESRDGDRAAEMMRKHLMHVENAIRKNLGKKGR